MDFSSVTPVSDAIDEKKFLKIVTTICRECGGDLDEKNYFSLRTSCIGFSPAQRCLKCGRLHWAGGALVFNRQNNAAYYQDGGIVYKDKNAKFARRSRTFPRTWD
jgi:hypothetical protein